MGAFFFGLQHFIFRVVPCPDFFSSTITAALNGLQPPLGSSFTCSHRFFPLREDNVFPCRFCPLPTLRQMLSYFCCWAAGASFSPPNPKFPEHYSLTTCLNQRFQSGHAPLRVPVHHMGKDGSRERTFDSVCFTGSNPSSFAAPLPPPNWQLTMASTVFFPEVFPRK